jgi:hypothetical protein
VAFNQKGFNPHAQFWNKPLNMKRSWVLLMDAAINLMLGLLLLFFSPGIIRYFGIPDTDTYFYPNILGAVLFGIGIALAVEFFRKEGRLVGLGLAGALCINLVGGAILALWLIFGNLDIPLHGRIFLWLLVFVLVLISTIELLISKYSNVD